MGTWLNNDGLYIRLGADEGKLSPHKVGEYNDLGGAHLVEIDLDLTKLTVGSDSILSDTVTVPKGYRVERVDVYVETAATSGGAATLDIGLVRQDRTTALDADGFVAAQAVGGLTNGANVVGAGALVGTALANAGLLVARANVAAFTAGKAKVRVKFYRP